MKKELKKIIEKLTKENEDIPKNYHHTVGAPPGKFVFWIYEVLPLEFKSVYTCTTHDSQHNYRFARYRKRSLVDEFLIVRTSLRCYRVIYYNNDFEFFRYFSAENYRECVTTMVEIFHIFQMLESRVDTIKKGDNEDDPKGT